MALKLPQSRQLGPNRTFGHRFVHLRQIRRRKQVVRDAIQSGELSTHLGASRFVVERVVEATFIIKNSETLTFLRDIFALLRVLEIVGMLNTMSYSS